MQSWRHGNVAARACRLALPSATKPVRSTFGQLIKEHVTKQGRRLFVFVDDLDRCLPEAAVGALEAIKLFLDIEDCVFVLGMDRHLVEQGIRVRYREFALAPGAEAQDQPVDDRRPSW